MQNVCLQSTGISLVASTEPKLKPDIHFQIFHPALCRINSGNMAWFPRMRLVVGILGQMSKRVYRKTCNCQCCNEFTNEATTNKSSLRSRQKLSEPCRITLNRLNYSMQSFFMTILFVIGYRRLFIRCLMWMWFKARPYLCHAASEMNYKWRAFCRSGKIERSTFHLSRVVLTNSFF